MVNVWLLNISPESFAKQIIKATLSAFDNYPANDGTAQVTTDITMTLNMTSKAERDSP